MRSCREGNVFLSFESLTNILLVSQNKASLITGKPANRFSQSPFWEFFVLPTRYCLPQILQAKFFSRKQLGD